MQPGHPAPDWTADALVDGQFKQMKLSDFKGKYLILLFYPMDLYAPTRHHASKILCLVIFHPVRIGEY